MTAFVQKRSLILLSSQKETLQSGTKLYLDSIFSACLFNSIRQAHFHG